MKKNQKQQMLIEEVRKRAKEMLKLCDEAQQGKLSAEEFEKRISKVNPLPPWITM